MKKKILIILLCTILFVLIGASLYLKRLVNDVNSITVSNLNMANITDGIYVGKYSITPVYVEVEVTVTEHKITNIKIIEHENGLGGKVEKIVDDVISRQSLEVDAVSGATVSSKCIIKAIENALQSGSK
ncbi:FMN-binding protein [Schaedlerella arabinosiphila]|uniref:FMN-binding protein n=1 Tax=Schaedlerella arabinosiphila TaxID=2044587 RepID=A0A3R8JQW3_9FIRM|nr:FMN-binding protein [Schaedlerella arabinosiphila]RRK34093.1 FMN-binding protein [Schaedlerella arabinosiphila]